jgi:hypothetical protein
MRMVVALVVVAPLASVSRAAPTVHRCLGEHGEIEFSDTACRTPLPPAGDAEPALAPWVRGGVCPTRTTELAALVTDAVSRGDANALAGLILWNGIGSSAAGERMRELDALLRRADVRVDFRGQPWPDAGVADGERVEIHGGNDPFDGVRLDLVASGGCHWLQW